MLNTRTSADELPRTRVLWPWAVAALVVALQIVQLGGNAFGRPGFGMDFQLLYTVAVAWGQGRNVYDDAVIKETWRACGDLTLPTPGFPVTPNVYPLTIAPLVWPFTLLPFHAALVAWTGVVLLAEAWLLLLMLRAADPRALRVLRQSTASPPSRRWFTSGTPVPQELPGSTLGSVQGGERVRLVPVALAVTLLVFSYPLRLNLASLNIGIVTAALALASIQTRRGAWYSGLCMGLALVKYSTTGPLLLLMAWRRQYRAVAIAVVVQACLLLAATWGGGQRSSLSWITAMRAEVARSLEPGAINAPDAALGAGMHLEFRSLWHRFFPHADDWHWLPVAALSAAALIDLLKTPRRPPSVPAASDFPAALILTVCMTAFYHRAYDLIPVLVLTLAWLVRPRSPRSVASRIEILTGMALALTALPGLWHGWDANAAPRWTRWVVQPACAWATAGLVPLLGLAMLRCGERVDSYRGVRGASGELPGI